MVNLPIINEAGTINPNRAYKITTVTLLQFFDKYLLGKPINLIDLKTTKSQGSTQLTYSNSNYCLFDLCIHTYFVKI